MLSSPKKDLPPPCKRRARRLNLQFQRVLTKHQTKRNLHLKPSRHNKECDDKEIQKNASLLQIKGGASAHLPTVLWCEDSFLRANIVTALAEPLKARSTTSVKFATNRLKTPSKETLGGRAESANDASLLSADCSSCAEISDVTKIKDAQINKILNNNKRRNPMAWGTSQHWLILIRMLITMTTQWHYSITRCISSCMVLLAGVLRSHRSQSSHLRLPPAPAVKSLDRL